MYIKLNLFCHRLYLKVQSYFHRQIEDFEKEFEAITVAIIDNLLLGIKIDDLKNKMENILQEIEADDFSQTDFTKELKKG